MNFVSRINIVTAILIALFALPILIGVVSPFSSRRLHRSLGSLMSSLIFLASVILSVYLTGRLLSDAGGPLLTELYKVLPIVQGLLARRDIWVYIIVTLLLAAVSCVILYLLTLPLYRFVLVPLTDRFSAAVERRSAAVRRTLGGIWELPKALITVVVFSLLLNFVSAHSSNTAVQKSIDASGVYQAIDGAVLEPLLSSELVKKIPVLLNDTFKEAAASLEARNIHLVRYFNGVTLDSAVKSNAEIDAEAAKLVGKETDPVKKAKLLYTWITKSITYDEKKAAAIAADKPGVPSGAAVAYSTRTGICFDYATLYVAMCRAVGVKVRFVTGLGYSGAAWGDHAWNQVFDPAGNRWLNVDTTFGASGLNYFDRASFDTDHQYAVVQGEW